MNEIQFNKNDFRFLLIGVAIIPVLCFISGFYMRDAFIKDNINNIKAIKMTNTTSLVTPQIKPIADKPKTNSDNKLNSEKPAKKDVNVKINNITSYKADSKPENYSRKIDIKANDSHETIKLYSFIVQAGLFSNQKNAMKLKKNLLKKDIDSKIVVTEDRNKKSYRIILNSFESKKEAKTFSKLISNTYNIKLYVSTLRSNNQTLIAQAL